MESLSRFSKSLSTLGLSRFNFTPSLNPNQPLRIRCLLASLALQLNTTRNVVNSVPYWCRDFLTQYPLDVVAAIYRVVVDGANE